MKFMLIIALTMGAALATLKYAYHVEGTVSEKLGYLGRIITGERVPKSGGSHTPSRQRRLYCAA